MFTGENLLRQSGASYTIVRPGGLTNKPSGRAKLVASTYFSDELSHIFYTHLHICSCIMSLLCRPGRYRQDRYDS